ncbi:hypothetical protein GCM10009853_032300 [Glycomyces scopariae]
MSTPSLTERRSPWIVITQTSDPWLEVETQRLQTAGGNIIRFDGRELLQQSQVFTAFDAAMSFPDFGRNWHALADCLHDWHAHGFDSTDVAIVIDHADDLVGKPRPQALLRNLRSPANLTDTATSARDIKTSMRDGRLLVSPCEAEWPSTTRTGPQ